ncbi:MAG: hypothetical protein QOE88_2440 [Verrucomicrobiota bacterium]|nr:hypothetical protein [Verrucomicrobiota bacterium]
MVRVVREDVQRDVGDRLDDVAVGQTRGVCLLYVGIADLAALHYDVARELEDCVGLLGSGGSVARVVDVLLCQADLTSQKGVRAQAVAAHVALGDGEGDLFADLGVEAATGERAAEVEVALERSWRSAEHAEKVRHDAQFILYAVEELFGLARRLCGVKLGDAVHVPEVGSSFWCSAEWGATIPMRRWRANVPCMA